MEHRGRNARPSDAELMQVICKLHSLTEQHRIPLRIPKLFVVGSQSRGKSTLIESMPGLNFNFCGNDIASRFPINFTMISDGACRSPAWRIGKFANICSTADVSLYVEGKNRELQQQNTVSKIPLDLEVRWERCPNLSFMDLPGLRALAMDEKEIQLQAQIEEMVQEVISEYCQKANVRFLVVEDAKEDTANYHGLSAIRRMYNNAINQAREQEDPENLERPDSPFILVLNKFDNFINSNDGNDQEKADKISTVVQKFARENIPVFFTSCPNMAAKELFRREIPADAPADDQEQYFIEAFRNWINLHSEQDQAVMERLIPGNQLLVGFNKLKASIEASMMNQYRRALPQVRNRLLTKKAEVLNATGFGGKNAEAVLGGFTSLVTNFSDVIRKLVSAKVCSPANSQSLEDEYGLLRDTLPQGDLGFSYRSSPVWKNERFAKEIRSIIYSGDKLHGGAQIRRVCWEFQLCSLVARLPSMEDDQFKQSVVNTRLAFNYRGGQRQVDWGDVLSEILNQYCRGLFKKDIQFFALRIESLLNSWFDYALGEAMKITGISDCPPQLVEELRGFFQSQISKWCQSLSASMNNFVQYTMEYDAGKFSLKVKETLGSFILNPTRTPADMFYSIVRELCPSKLKDSKNASLLSSLSESQVLFELLGNTSSDIIDLELREADQPNDERVLDKIKTICGLQLQLGCKIIGEMFPLIFDTTFKDPLDQKLARKLARWRDELPKKLEEKVKLSSKLYNNIQEQISELDHIMEALSLKP